jgi:hypothetical protein
LNHALAPWRSASTVAWRQADQPRLSEKGRNRIN